MTLSEHIFVCHSSEDRELTQKVVDVLEELGHACWVDFRNIRLGQDYFEAIVEALHASSGLLLLLTPDAVRSPDVRREVKLAAELGLNLLPIVVDGTSPAGMAYVIGTAHQIEGRRETIPDLVRRHFDPELREAYGVGRLRRALRWLKKRRKPIGLAGIVLLACLGLTAFLLIRPSSAGAPQVRGMIPPIGSPPSQAWSVDLATLFGPTDLNSIRLVNPEEYAASAPASLVLFGDSTKDGVSKGLVAVADSGTGRVKWSKASDSAGMVCAGDLVDTHLACGTGGRLLLFDLENGKVAKEFTVEAQVWAVSVAENTIVTLSQAPGESPKTGKPFRVQVTLRSFSFDGAKRWQVSRSLAIHQAGAARALALSTNDEIVAVTNDGTWDLNSPPMVASRADGKVLSDKWVGEARVRADGMLSLTRSQGGKAMTELRSSAGDSLWAASGWYDTIGTWDHPVMDLPVLFNDLTYLGAYSRSGERLWSAQPADAQAVCSGLVLGRDKHGKITAIDYTTGAVRWTVAAPLGDRLQPQVRCNSQAAVMMESASGATVIAAHALNDGSILWTAPFLAGSRNTLIATSRGLVLWQLGSLRMFR